ncbi:DUF5317 family protein [Desulfitobacterium sp. Sab5]|uniref:DUF5317 family protein n=1 Tax=Desulfitobacterium nosdiversum TaxID=3375356 RepID=UPI003CF59698
MFNIPVYIPIALLAGIILIFIESYALRKMNSLKAYVNVLVISLCLGLCLVLTGLCLNIVSIKANGGMMKADIAVVEQVLESEVVGDSWYNFYDKDQIRLYPLCDRFYAPNLLVFNGAFYSIGDMLLWIALAPLITIIPLDIMIYRKYLYRKNRN